MNFVDTFKKGFNVGKILFYGYFFDMVSHKVSRKKSKKFTVQHFKS